MRTTVRREVFGGIPLELEQLADESAALDALPADVGSEQLEELCPYFGVVWASARALADALAARGAGGPAGSSRGLRGVRVLELGCGLAAPSLVAARLGADVLATDYHPDVPALLERNAARNQARVAYARVDLRRAEELPRGFDLVLAADDLYLPELVPLVVRAIDVALAPGGAALVTDPGRPSLQAFVDRAQEAGLRCAIEVRSVPDPPRPRRDVFVLTLTR